ncbi:MAG: hypothetical protein HRU00_14200 [Myxococcales bacterium]|nr:hypothetical protein [Myxococcales bacterium]
MAAVTVDADDRPYAQLRSTTPATPNDLREVVLPAWTRTFTVESPTGGTALKVARTGVDDAAIGANYVDVVAGAGPRVFVASSGQQAAEITSIFVASTGAAVAFVVEAEAARR